MCKDAPLLIYKRFFGCPSTLVMSCGVESLSALFDYSMSEIVLIESFCVLSLQCFLGRCVLSLLGSLFWFLLFLGTCIETLLDFLFVWHTFFVFIVFFVVCIGFDLRESILLGFLVGRTTSFRKSTSLSGSISKKIRLRTQCRGKLIQKWLFLPCFLDM